MRTSFSLEPIGHVTSERDATIDDDWDCIVTHIDLDASRFDTEALMGLSTFSHVEIFFIFDRVPLEKIETGARHPRGQKEWPRVGIFAQRGKNRPNRLGATICRVVSVEDLRLTVAGLDAINGTPVIDIKPVLSGFERRGELREPDWAKEIMSRYW